MLPRRLLLGLLSCLCLCAVARGQQPFNTDDADVTDKGKWHVEFANEYDVLAKETFPNLRQNTANVKLAYGLAKGVEVGLDNQIIYLRNARTLLAPRSALGYGDLDFSIKWNFLPEKEGSRRPAFTASFATEFPTGDARRQLGSGLTDYAGNAVAQFPLTSRTRLRLNAGMVFAGNTLTGAVGLRTRGTVFTGGSSLVHEFTDKLRLGVEITGAATSNFDLGRGALQSMVGGNYRLRKQLSFDFGITGGTFPGAPRLGGQMGFSVDF